MEGTLVAELLKSTIALFVIVDPVGVLPFVAFLTKGFAKEERRRVIDRSVLTGTALLLIFSVAGHIVLSVLGISVASVMVAGGLLLMILAFRILIQGGEGWQVRESATSIFPIAFPLLAGPGAITTVILSITSLGLPYSVIPVLVVMTLTWLVMRTIDAVLAVIGENGADAVARIMSVFIAAIGVQYVLTGIVESAALFRG